MSELQNKILTAEPVPCSTHPILYDETKCVGCNACTKACTQGLNVMACPHDGAIRLEHPLMNRAKFVPVRYPEEK